MSALLPVAMAAGNAALTQLSTARAASRRRSASRAEAARLSAQAAEQDRLRRQRLREAVARARARFGAAGLRATDGSAAAHLGGLAAESERAGAHALATVRSRLKALRRDGRHADRLALLQGARRLLAAGGARR